MIHSFSIVKQQPGSMANVIANYLDAEHGPAHSGLSRASILAEAESVVCFRLDSRILGLTVTNLHYFEYRAPNQVLQVVKTPLGPMRVLATVRELDAQTPRWRCETDVFVELDMPSALFLLRGAVERLLRALNKKVHEEDLAILQRRYEKLGGGVADYLRPEQYLMCKASFERSFAGDGGLTAPLRAHPTPAARQPA